MTNQEAITKLTNILNDDTYAWHPAHAEALEMAIDALKVIEIKRDSSDLISRQEAIDALGERPRLWTGGDYELGCANQYDLDRNAIETVPSTQSETCEGCKHLGKWDDEVEYGYPSPCTCCKRRVEDHYER